MEEENRRVMIDGFGIALILIGAGMILVTNLQVVADFQTLPYLIVIIFGACILNRELLSGHQRMNLFALLSFILGISSCSITGAPLPTGALTISLVFIFGACSIIAAVISMVMNQKEGGKLGGNKSALTGVVFSLACILPASVPFFYDPNGHFQRGESYFNKGDYDQAIVEYEKTIRQEPQFIDAYCRRALAYFCLQKYERSWQDIKTAEARGYPCASDLIAKLKSASGGEEEK